MDASSARSVLPFPVRHPTIQFKIMAKRGSLRNRWIFTLNNYTEAEVTHMHAKVTEDECECAVVGEEVGAEGTPHLQGYVHFKKQKRLTSVKKLLERAHWEPARGTAEQNLAYCSKDGKVVIQFGQFNSPEEKRKLTIQERATKAIEMRCRGSYADEIIADPVAGGVYLRHLNAIDKAVSERQAREGRQQAIIKKYTDVTWRDWQRELLEELEGEPDDRKIIWYVDEKGGSGKSFLAHYLRYCKQAMVVSNGRTCDIAYLYKQQRIVVFDLVRSSRDHINYEIMEKCKDGYVVSVKYQPIEKEGLQPHVIVFSNAAPDYSNLSADRWDVRTL